MTTLFVLLFAVLVLLLAAYVLKDSALSIAAGIMVVMVGLNFLTENFDQMYERLEQGVGVLLCLVGIYMTTSPMWTTRAKRKAAKKKQDEETEIVVERSTDE